MTKGNFTDALLELDEKYVEMGLNETPDNEKVSRPKRKIKLLVAAIAIAVAVEAVTAALVFSVVQPMENPDNKNFPMIPEEENTNAVIIGCKDFNEAPKGHTSPLSSSSIVKSNTLSFFETGKDINVNMAVGYVGHLKEYEVEKDYFKYFMLRIVDDSENEDRKLILNGSSGIYEYEYPDEEYDSLCLDIRYSKRVYKLETLTIDFSKLKIGDEGTVQLGFGWCSENEIPDYFEIATLLENGMYYYNYSQLLYYRVIEDGIELSYASFPFVDYCRKNQNNSTIPDVFIKGIEPFDGMTIFCNGEFVEYHNNQSNNYNSNNYVDICNDRKKDIDEDSKCENQTIGERNDFKCENNYNG